MYTPTKYLIVVFLACAAVTLAQNDSMRATELPNPAKGYFRFNYDNDFFSATDRYYTQGTYLDFVLPFVKSPLSKLIFSEDENRLNYYTFRLRQDCFTPRSIRHDSIYFGERPFTGMIYISNFLISVSPLKKQRFTTGIDIGVMGPEGKAAETQKSIHTWLENIQPLGWEYQLATDIVLNYNVCLEKGFITNKKFEFIGIGAARAGTIYDDIGAGVLLRAGWMPAYFESLGIGYNSNSPTAKKNRLKCYVFAKGEAKAVFYNATLQGGMFNKESIYVLPASSVSRVVCTATTGIVIAYKRFSVEYTKIYISPEFKGGLPHGWGHCAITAYF